MIWVSQIENGVAHQHHQFFIFTEESSGKRLVGGLNNYAFAYPLPKLFLGRPEFFAIATDYQRGFFLFSFLLLSLLDHNCRYRY